MVHHEQEFIANKGDDIGPEHIGTSHVTPKGDSSLSGSGNGLHGAGEPEFVGHGQHGTIEVSPVLEEEAQSKGRWASFVSFSESVERGDGRVLFLFQKAWSGATSCDIQQFD